MEPSPPPPAVDCASRGRRPRPSYWLTRFVFLRLLGFVYAFAFWSLLRQLVPLLGADGLLPIPLFLRQVAAALGPGRASWSRLPTLFWWRSDDAFLLALAWLGLALSLLLLCGLANAPLLAALWAIYMSFVHVGQIFYGFGWEILLLECGFLAIFLPPLLRPGPLPRAGPPPRASPPSLAVVWLLRWLLFRVMFGAGLIKLRGDSCWRDLTCLRYHYETQPLPNALSWLLHQAPNWFHTLEALGNHATELVVPFLLFGPRRLRHVGGAITIAFQIWLLLSGNLSFLNYLTIAIAVACFDDSLLARLLPRGLGERARGLAAAAPRPTLARRGH
jgi:Lipase maturation factor